MNYRRYIIKTGEIFGLFDVMLLFAIKNISCVSCRELPGVTWMNFSTLIIRFISNVCVTAVREKLPEDRFSALNWGQWPGFGSICQMLPMRGLGAKNKSKDKNLKS